MKHVGATAIALLALSALTGCGADREGTQTSLREGVYQYELSESYLRENGISAQQAADEHGTHEVTLTEGRFIDRWLTGRGIHGSCWGTYAAQGNGVTFHFTGGCFGDWSMRYAVDGDVVEWSGVEALAPNNGPEEQKIAEVFNGVPWIRVGEPR